MSGFALVAMLCLACAAVPYFVVERRWRWRWREIAAGRVAADAVGGAYRAAGDVPRFRERAPASVRLAAFSSLLVGQLFVPLTLVGAFTILYFGLGVLTVPYLITCAKLYRAGLTLLHRDPRLAYFRARDAAQWAAWLGEAPLVVATLVVLLCDPPGLIVLWRRPLVGLALAGAILFVVARLLLHVTRKWEDALFEASAHPTVTGRSSML